MVLSSSLGTMLFKKSTIRKAFSPFWSWVGLKNISDACESSQALDGRLGDAWRLLKSGTCCLIMIAPDGTVVGLRIPSNGVDNASFGRKERRSLTFDGPACSGTSPAANLVHFSSICLWRETMCLCFACRCSFKSNSANSCSKAAIYWSSSSSATEAICLFLCALRELISSPWQYSTC